MALTNRASGPAEEKPAYWLDANIHATEVTGSMGALHLISRPSWLTPFEDSVACHWCSAANARSVAVSSS
jgi:hypothetical protein